jgi:hypothetical protein
MTNEIRLGATFLADGRCRCLVYAPLAETVEVRLLSPRAPARILSRDERGYHQGVLEDISPGDLYIYMLDGQKERPDPASRVRRQEKWESICEEVKVRVGRARGVSFRGLDRTLWLREGCLLATGKELAMHWNVVAQIRKATRRQWERGAVRITR